MCVALPGRLPPAAGIPSLPRPGQPSQQPGAAHLRVGRLPNQAMKVIKFVDRGRKNHENIRRRRNWCCFSRHVRSKDNSQDVKSNKSQCILFCRFYLHIKENLPVKIFSAHLGQYGISKHSRCNMERRRRILRQQPLLLLPLLATAAAVVYDVWQRISIYPCIVCT